MRSQKLKAFLLGGAFFAVAGRGWAAVTVLLSADNEAYQEAAAGVKELVPDAEVSVIKDGKAELSAGAVAVTLGDAAAALALPQAGGRVAAMLADTGVAFPAKAVKVGNLPDAFSLISTINNMLPKFETLAVFSVGHRYDAYMNFLAAAAKVSSLKLKIYRLQSSADLVGALRDLPGHADALWVALDPFYVNLENFKLISGVCLSAKIALIAPSPFLTQAGALAALAPSSREIGRAAGRAAAQLAQGKNPGLNVQPEKSELTVNQETAKALGLHLKP